ncbi:hypothetical protein I4U23_023097 [Adineta vaga]|nr:hypothetical protein I4U23_023097 [Adineta vaga]
MRFCLITFLLILLNISFNSSLICFQCVCFLNQCECEHPSETNEHTHCTITRTDPLVNSISHLTHTKHNSTLDNYYLIVKKSIVYSEKSKDWLIKPYEIMYGCDWDYCNDPKLILLLTEILKVTIDRTWFTKNIYGTGLPMKCYDCQEKLCNKTIYPIDFSRCPTRTCANFEICRLHTFINNAFTNEQCFHGKCITEDHIDESNESSDGKYKVLLKILIYLAQNRSDFHIYGLDIVCNAKYCSRTTIFDEVKQQIFITIGNLTVFPLIRPTTTSTITTTTNTTTHKSSISPTTSISSHLKCYNGSSINMTIGEYWINTTHCMINYNEQHATFSSISFNSSQSYVREFPYILIQQSIIYNKTIHDWSNKTDFISYGCNWNLCNEPRLLSSLSNSIHLSLNKSWLNANVFDLGFSTRDCNQCPNNLQCSTYEVSTFEACPTKKCNHTCFLSNIYNHIANNQQCYRSFCESSDPDLRRVIIQGILYLNRSQLNVELWEVYIPCHAADCSRLEIFRESQQQRRRRRRQRQRPPPPPPQPQQQQQQHRQQYHRFMIDIHYEVVDFLLNENNTANVTAIANALTVYFGTITSMDIIEQEQLNRTLTPDLIDTLVGILNISLIQNSTTSFLICRSIYEEDVPLGISFQSGIGGQIILNSTENDLIHSNFTAAVMISSDSIISNEITYLNMFIIDKPSIEYYRLNNSNEKLLSSSIIVVKTQQNYFETMNVTIYFRILSDIEHDENTGEYYCSFYDIHTSSWNESGCTYPIYNSYFQRYECNCDHLTSFALIWLPKTLEINEKKSLDLEDIFSLMFQLISILCFLLLLLHSFIKHHFMKIEARDLLPLISCASTICVFIFYIALVLTVYTQSTSFNENNCFPLAHVLMFIVYFLLIFMFCTKTSVGYFNYLRFVRPFSPPTFQRLRTLILISFVISIVYVLFAIGFNTKQSFQITQLYPYRICWFTKHVIHYFLTIPIIIFLLLNIIMIFLVAKCLINHTRNVISLNQLNRRTKMCVIVLLSSCVTQGVAWLLGPLLSVINSTNIHSLSWLFIIFNGLEGLWSIILYIIIIRVQKFDGKPDLVTSDTLTKLSSVSSNQQQKRKL